MAIARSVTQAPSFIDDLAKDYGTQLTGLTGDYQSEQSEFMRNIIGADDAVLQEIFEVNADVVDFRWKPRAGFDKSDFQRGLDILQTTIFDL